MTQECYHRLLTRLPMPGCSYFAPEGLPNKFALAGDHHLLEIQQLREWLSDLGIADAEVEIVYGVRPKNAPDKCYVLLLPLPND